jgi:hypothetical protein
MQRQAKNRGGADHVPTRLNLGRSDRKSAASLVNADNSSTQFLKFDASDCSQQTQMSAPHSVRVGHSVIAEPLSEVLRLALVEALDGLKELLPGQFTLRWRDYRQ